MRLELALGWDVTRFVLYQFDVSSRNLACAPGEKCGLEPLSRAGKHMKRL